MRSREARDSKTPLLKMLTLFPQDSFMQRCEGMVLSNPPSPPPRCNGV